MQSATQVAKATKVAQFQNVEKQTKDSKDKTPGYKTGGCFRNGQVSGEENQLKL